MLDHFDGVDYMARKTRRKAQMQKAKRGRDLYQILAYSALANNGLLTDSVAIPDTSFSARGGSTGANHWIFTESYKLMACTFAGATVTQAQLFDATWNAINIPQIYPGIFGGIVPPSNPNVMDLRRFPPPIPMNEEIALQISGGAGGAEDDYGLIWIMPSSQSFAEGIPTPTLNNNRVFALVTATVVLTAGVWSPFANINFVNPIKGGGYQLNGAHWIVPHALAYKINFVRGNNYGERKMFPGGLVENAYGDVPLRYGANWLGPMGTFNNFELPQVSVLGTTSEASATYTGVLDLTYKGSVGGDAAP